MQKTSITWRPVPENLPDCSGEVLVTIQNHFGNRVLATLWVHGQKRFATPRGGKVIAWAPLPTSYEPATLKPAA